MMDRDLGLIGRDVLKIFGDLVVSREPALHLQFQDRGGRELLCDRANIGDRLLRVFDLSLTVAETVASRDHSLAVNGDENRTAVADLVEFLEIRFNSLDGRRIGLLS